MSSMTLRPGSRTNVADTATKMAEHPNRIWRYSEVSSPLTYEGTSTNANAATNAYHGSPPTAMTRRVNSVKDVNDEYVVPFTSGKIEP